MTLTSNFLTHEGYEGRSLAEPYLDVLHVNFHAVLKNLLIGYVEARPDLIHRALDHFQFVRTVIPIR